MRPAQAEKRLAITLVGADGAVLQEVQAANAGAAVRAEGLRFPKGGQVYLKIANHPYSSESEAMESEYTAQLTPSGGAATAVASPGATAPGAPAPTEAGSWVQRARVFFVWSVLPLGAGLLVGLRPGFPRRPRAPSLTRALERPQRVRHVGARGAHRGRHAAQRAHQQGEHMPGPRGRGVIRNANARCENVCQLMVPVVMPLTGSTAGSRPHRPPAR